MKIELKNIKIFLAMSEETTAFVGTVYVDGVKTAHAKNDGHGGNTYYHAVEGKRDLLNKAEEYCKTLPPIKGDGYTFDMDLEGFIDELVYAELQKKEKKKFEKQMVNSLMWGIPNAIQYTRVSYIKPLTEIPTLNLQMEVDRIKKQFKEGEVFLNTNLQELGVKL